MIPQSSGLASGLANGLALAERELSEALGRLVGEDLAVRTHASPLCRAMMRPKVFHGTNSITCANSVLPMFMRHSRLSNPESIANKPHASQIVDTLKSP